MAAFPSRTTMRVHYFQRVPFEGLGSIASWLSVSGATVTCTRFFDNSALPDLEGIDMLVVEKEIGWFPIFSTGASTPHFLFRFPPAATVFHWHGETFDLPPGAAPLARSAGCENQAFQLGRRVIGMQFHLETTPESACDLVSQCRNELEPSRHVQSEQIILTADAQREEFIHTLMSHVLDFVTRRLPPGG